MPHAMVVEALFVDRAECHSGQDRRCERHRRTKVRTGQTSYLGEFNDPPAFLRLISRENNP